MVNSHTQNYEGDTPRPPVSLLATAMGVCSYKLQALNTLDA